MSFLEKYSERELARLAEETNVITKRNIHGFDVYCAGEDTALAKVRVVFNHGSSVDEVEGVHHALEHMMFKGKNKVLVERLEFLGANINASTSMLKTVFILECSVFKLMDAIPLFAKLFEDFSVNAEDWDKERSVIHSERIQCETDHDSIAWDNVTLALYADDVKSNILGTEDSINRITLEDLTKAYAKMVFRQNTYVVLTCAKSLLMPAVELLTTSLAEYIGMKRNIAVDDSTGVKLRGSAFYLRQKQLEYIQYKDLTKCYVLDLDPMNPVHDLVAYFISTYISGGLSSPLFTEIREKLGSVYSCNTYIYRNHIGLTLCFSVGVHAEDITPYEDAVDCIMDDIEVNGITEEGFERTKNALEYWFAKSSERGVIDPIGYYASVGADKVYEASHMMYMLSDMSYETMNNLVSEVIGDIKSTVVTRLHPVETGVTTPCTDSTLIASNPKV